MDVKQAVQAAAGHVAYMEAFAGGMGEGYDEAEILRQRRFSVEGTHFDEGKCTWRIDVGFTRPWDKAKANPLGGLSAAPDATGDKRTVKTVTLSDESGEVIDYGD